MRRGRGPVQTDWQYRCGGGNSRVEVEEAVGEREVNNDSWKKRGSE